MKNQHYSPVSGIGADGFTRLMEEYGEDVWHYAFFLTKKTDLADDIAQEVFIKAYKAVGHFRGESSIKTWLLKITRNTVFSYRRKAYFRLNVLVRNVPASGALVSAEQEYMEQQFVHEIWSCVLALPRKFREVIILNGYHQMAMEEIADTLQISVNTAKSRLHRARKALSLRLEEVREDGQNAARAGRK